MGASRRPGPDGAGHAPSRHIPSNWTGAAMGWIRSQVERAGETVESAANTASRTAKSTVVGILDLLPVKPDSPFSTRLLRHYIEGSGEPYELDQIPEEWQVWIVQATKARPGRHASLNPYNSGLYDLRNSLGHFDVVVTRAARSKTAQYDIEDVYEFGYIRGDRNQRGRHGFPLGQAGDATRRLIEMSLPKDEHWNPGGFREKWEIRTVGKETILYIPQQVLAEQGKPFKVHGRFER